MQEYKLSVNTIDKVKKFVQINIKHNINIFVKSNNFVVDGKSIMGLFSLDLARPIIVYSDSPQVEVDKYIKDVKEFLI